MRFLKVTSFALISIISSAAGAGELNGSEPLSTWRNADDSAKERLVMKVASELQQDSGQTERAQVPIDKILRCMNYNVSPDQSTVQDQTFKISVGTAVSVCLKVYNPSLRTVQYPPRKTSS